MNKLTDTKTLTNGGKIPVVGFGTWQSLMENCPAFRELAAVQEEVS